MGRRRLGKHGPNYSRSPRSPGVDGPWSWWDPDAMLGLLGWFAVVALGPAVLFLALYWVGRHWTWAGRVFRFIGHGWPHRRR